MSSMKIDAQTAALLKKSGYVVQQQVHKGTFGNIVFRGTYNTDKEVAIKVMFIEKLGKMYDQMFKNGEMTALMEIRHDNVIEVYDIIRSSGKLYIFMEFANGGDISVYLLKHGAMSEALTCYWFTQCTQAMTFMHDQHNFAHRDIQTDNLLLHNNRVKMTGFGHSTRRYVDECGNVEISKGVTGYAPYHSPQMLYRKQYNPFAADVWMLGIAMFAMLNNKYPFRFDEPKAQLAEQMNSKFLAKCYIKRFSADLLDLQEKLLLVDDSKRITMAQVLKHPWIIRKGK